MITIAEGRYIDPRDVSMVIDVSTINTHDKSKEIPSTKGCKLVLDITAGTKERSWIITKQGVLLKTSLKADTFFKKLKKALEDA